MAGKYSIITTAYRRYEVSDEYNRLIGCLDYPSWLSSDAQITTKDGITYDLSVTGFWRRQITLISNGIPFAQLKYQWQSTIEIVFANGGSLVFKRKSLLNSTFVILGSADMKVAAIQVGFNWRKLNFDYAVEVFDNKLDTEINLLLPFLLVYCVKNVRARQAAVRG